MIRASVLAQNCDRVTSGGAHSRTDDDRRGRWVERTSFVG